MSEKKIEWIFDNQLRVGEIFNRYEIMNMATKKLNELVNRIKIALKTPKYTVIKVEE